MRVGVIVAGGYSTRFETGDKALADIAGKPMLRHVADRLSPVIDALVINGRAEQMNAFADAMEGFVHPVEYALDEQTGRGPVAGIAAGLAAVPIDAKHVVVVACDMPFVDSSIIERLFELAMATPADAIVPRTDDGFYQVLHAVYSPRPMVDACRRTLIDGDPKVLAPLEYLEVEVIDSDALSGLERSVENVNTRESIERARHFFD